MFGCRWASQPTRNCCWNHTGTVFAVVLGQSHWTHLPLKSAGADWFRIGLDSSRISVSLPSSSAVKAMSGHPTGAEVCLAAGSSVGFGYLFTAHAGVAASYWEAHTLVERIGLSLRAGRSSRAAATPRLVRKVEAKRDEPRL